ncbi:hypothetical protein XH96_14015 [Bradyrhizobium sp. CCBAU 51765]|nr:hypothetical protein XH96_14015 [Bradyrhizobium sp. CCBAU 51765]
MHRASREFEPRNEQNERGRASPLCPFFMSALELRHSGMRRKAQARNPSAAESAEKWILRCAIAHRSCFASPGMTAKPPARRTDQHRRSRPRAR